MTATARHSAWAASAYGAMIVGSVALFFVIRSFGETLSAPPPAAATALATPGGPDVLWHLLLALTAVVIAGQVLSGLFRWIGQPPVIGQVVAGILLGPSLLGRVAPEAFHYVLPPQVAPFLGVLAQLGVILYMFLVGLELNPDLLRGQVRATASTSHA